MDWQHTQAYFTLLPSPVCSKGGGGKDSVSFSYPGRDPGFLHQVASPTARPTLGPLQPVGGWRKRSWSSRQDVLRGRPKHGRHTVHGLELVTRHRLTAKEPRGVVLLCSGGRWHEMWSTHSVVSATHRLPLCHRDRRGLQGARVCFCMNQGQHHTARVQLSVSSRKWSSIRTQPHPVTLLGWWRSYKSRVTLLQQSLCGPQNQIPADPLQIMFTGPGGDG